MSSVTQVLASGIRYVDDLISHAKWLSPTVTYSFATSASSYGSKYGMGETAAGFASLNPSQQAAARDAFSIWSDVADIRFATADAATAEIRLAVSSMPKTSWAYTPSDNRFGGDVWIGTASYNANPLQGNYAYFTIMHEIGHAIGLGHPHEAKPSSLASSIAGESAAKFGTSSITALDGMAYSVMSYKSFIGADISKGYSNETFGYAQTPMARDIATIQHLYGANYSTRSTDTVYSWNEKTGEKSINGIGQGAPGSNKVFETIWDGGGTDTFNLSNFTSNLDVNINPGAWTKFGTGQIANLGLGEVAPGNVAVAYLYEGDARALIENVVGGSGKDTINGNAANNVLVGGAGDDTLRGHSGKNILVGDLLGNELKLVGLTNTGLSAAFRGQANGNDILIGGDHNDILIPGLGKNIVDGGAGSDTLVLDFAYKTLVLENGSNGAITIKYSGGSVTATNIEFLAVQDGIFSLVGPNDNDYADDIALLYQAGLGRELDTGGLRYWLDFIENGGKIEHMAQTLIDSTEFVARFGNAHTMANSDFVSVLYENVLRREGSQGEIDYWADSIDAGQSKDQVLLAFADGAENRASIASAGLNDSVQIHLISQAQWVDIWA